MVIRENVKKTQAHNPSSFLEMIINNSNNKLLIRLRNFPFYSCHPACSSPTVAEESKSGLLSYLMDGEAEVWELCAAGEGISACLRGGCVQEVVTRAWSQENQPQAGLSQREPQFSPGQNKSY